MARISVSISDPFLEELRQFVPDQDRRQFVVEAVQEKLSRLKQRLSLRASAGSWSNAERGDPALEIRRLRESWDRRGRQEREAC